MRAQPCLNTYLSTKFYVHHLDRPPVSDRDYRAVSFIDLGPFNTVVALVIATLKALLVVLIFMHVKYTSEKLTKSCDFRDLLSVPVLLALSMADYTTRLWS